MSKKSHTKLSFIRTSLQLGAFVLLGCTLSACASGNKKYVDYGVKASPRVVAEGQPVPKGGGVYRVGKEYKVAGKWYQPKEDMNYDRTGVASWYGKQFHGRLTANGEIFDMHSLSVAHKTLPMPSYVRVTNVANGRSIMARVNDRGPYHGNREIDLSYKVAQVLGITRTGTGQVRVQYTGRARLDGKDDHLFQTAEVNGQPVSVASLLGNDGVQYASVRERQAPTTQVASLADVAPPAEAWRAEGEPIQKANYFAEKEPKIDIASQNYVEPISTAGLDNVYIENMARTSSVSSKSDGAVSQVIAEHTAPINLELPRPRPQI